MYQIREIPNFPGYFADINGNIYSKKIHFANSIGKLKKLTLFKNHKKYLQVILYKNNEQYCRRVSRLILETFVGLCPDGTEACHNNGIKHDNNLSNLRWDTHSNNCKDKIKHNTLYIPSPDNTGENNGRSKLNELQVRIIKYLLKYSNMTQKEIGNIFCVSRGCINHINRNCWKHI